MPAVIDPRRTVAELLLENPARAAVFEAHRIDYCCHGKKSLAEALAQRGVAFDAIAQRIAECDAVPPSEEESDAAAMSCAELVEDILVRHHAFVKRELPRLTDLAEKVARVHGGHAPAMVKLAGVVRGLRAELESHMEKEEKVLFPYVVRMERGEDSPFPTIGAPISCMEHEHSDAGEALEKIHALTDGLVPPEGACNTWRVLYHALAAFERDLHLHIHKENNILFPRALAMEAAMRKQARPSRYTG